MHSNRGKIHVETGPWHFLNDANGNNEALDANQGPSDDNLHAK
jgi:hypothetical protein